MNILFDERLDGELVQRDKSEVLSDLQQAVPDMTLLHREEDLRPFECDGLAAYRVLPMLVALPETLQQVEGLLKRCHALGVPVVTRGAGTGLSGGALPLEQGVLLVMSRFNKILSVDPDARMARVQPGVRNLAISEAAAPYGLYYAPTPPRKLPARSAVTWLKMPAACTV
ncbi:FAD linked oxidase domain-containing protein [Halomonas sp. KO116]|nr:FAD linked oxidase domain-containing protein [Halomonas sp. KO116]